MRTPPSNLQLSAHYPHGALRAEHRRGTLVRLRRGAYVPADANSEDAQRVHDRCVAVAQQLRTRYAFSHDTAAVLHQLPTFRISTDVVHVVQEVRPSGSRSPDIVRHVTKTLPPSDISLVDRLPVTTLERTCIDYARSAHPAHALAVADAVLRRLSGTTRFSAGQESAAAIKEDLAERIERLGPRRGVVGARAVIAHADARSESPAESWVRWLMLTTGFAVPDLQTPVVTDQGTFYPDLLWSGAVVRGNWRFIGVEYDGVAKYQSPDDLYAEKVREDALRAAGCLVIRATRADRRDPRRLVATVGQHVLLDPDGPRRALLPRR